MLLEKIGSRQVVGTCSCYNDVGDSNLIIIVEHKVICFSLTWQVLVVKVTNCVMRVTVHRPSWMASDSAH